MIPSRPLDTLPCAYELWVWYPQLQRHLTLHWYQAGCEVCQELAAQTQERMLKEQLRDLTSFGGY